MTLMDKACFERGCICYDSQDHSEYVEVVEKKEWIGLTPKEELHAEDIQIHGVEAVIKWVEAKLKSKNVFDSTEKNT